MSHEVCEQNTDYHTDRGDADDAKRLFESHAAQYAPRLTPTSVGFVTHISRGRLAMGFLSKDEILGTDDRSTKDVGVPEWGGTVRVRALSGTDRDAYEASLSTLRPDGTGGMQSVPDTANARAKLVARAIVDENGERVFGDHEVSRLGLKSAAALTRVFLVAAELSGLGDDAEQAIEGNSDAAQGGDSSSD